MTLPAPTIADPAPNALGLPLVRTTLDNGLTVCVVPDPSTPMVGVNVTYRVGSRDETDGLRGVAHWFEHLMFAGSRHVKAGEHTRLISSIGGNGNATTDMERTNYFETVPAGGTELALWLEADRMGSMPERLDETSMNTERAVVAAEQLERANQPFGTLWEEGAGALFPPGHIYHHLPIGIMADLEAATRQDLADFFATHYSPANAVLTVAGNVEAATVMRWTERYFGGIPLGAGATTRPTSTLATHRGRVQREVFDDVPTPTTCLFHQIPPAPGPDYVAAGLALDILLSGRASRIWRALVVKERILESCGAGAIGLSGGSAIALSQLMVRSSVSFEQAEQAFAAEVERFAELGPTPAELERARRLKLRGIWQEVATSGGLANYVGEKLAAFDHLDPLAAITDQFEGVDAESVASAARYFTPDNSAVIRYPGKENAR